MQQIPDLPVGSNWCKLDPVIRYSYRFGCRHYQIEILDRGLMQSVSIYLGTMENRSRIAYTALDFFSWEWAEKVVNIYEDAAKQVIDIS